MHTTNLFSSDCCYGNISFSIVTIIIAHVIFVVVSSLLDTSSCDTTAHGHPSVPFGAQAAALESKFHPATPRFTGTLPQTPNVRTMGPSPQGSRGPFNASRK